MINIEKLTQETNKYLGYPIRDIQLNEEFVKDLVERADKTFTYEQANNFVSNISEEGRDLFIKHYVLAEAKRSLALLCRRFKIWEDIDHEQLSKESANDMKTLWDKAIYKKDLDNK